MNTEAIEKVISFFMKGLFITLVFLVVVSMTFLEATKKSPEEIEDFLEGQRAMYQATRAEIAVNPNLPKLWPPKMNASYPEMKFINQAGEEFNLSDLQGRAIILDFIDMRSAISQAQSGAVTHGTYGSLNYTDKITQTFAAVVKESTAGQVTLPHPKIIELKVIVYGENGEQAAVDDAQNWASHFKMGIANNVIVAVPIKDLRDEPTKQMLGGYQVLDTNLMLRADSSGPSPKHSLKLTTAPLIPQLVR